MYLHEYKQAYLTALENVTVDMETGEITGIEELEAAEGQLSEKMEAMACYIKDLAAMQAAIEAEAKKLKERAAALEKKGEYLKGQLLLALDGIGQKKFETPKCHVSYRESTQVIITSEADLPAEYITVKITEERKPDKNGIKAAIKAGAEIAGAVLQTNRNIQIK